VGNYHNVFLKSDGGVWTFGYNALGQLGDGSQSDRAEPVQIATGAKKVAVGYWRSFFIKNDDSLWGAGYNPHGELHPSSNTVISTPILIATDVADVTAGGTSTGAGHIMIVKTDESLLTAGVNDVGQLGDGTTIIRPSPVKVAKRVTKVAAGGMHSLYLQGPVDPQAEYAKWSKAGGLVGNNANPQEVPWHDGVPNLLKYAFNLAADRPHCATLHQQSPVFGLPSIQYYKDWDPPILHVEYLRRKDSGLIYEPRVSSELNPESFEIVTGDTGVVTPIDSDWERVTIFVTCDPHATPRLFVVIGVTLPNPP
jgi:hypothetical protein